MDAVVITVFHYAELNVENHLASQTIGSVQLSTRFVEVSSYLDLAVAPSGPGFCGRSGTMTTAECEPHCVALI